MTRHNWIWLLLAVWVALYAASFVVAHATAPTGDSFLRGANRLIVFLQYQGLAAAVAALIWWQGRGMARGTWARRLSWAPAGLTLALVLTILAVVAVAVIRGPATEPPPPPGSTTVLPGAE